MSIFDWPDALRAAGLNVYERPGWRGNHPLGSLPSHPRKIYWHHDGSPAGSSPGAWDWICSAYDSKQPSAQLWMDYNGQWRFVGCGVAYHAGTTVDSSDWNTTVGLETDHTNNEGYSDQMMNSLHRGFAAIAKVEGRNADFMTFHKIEARPMGRKVDPYLSVGRSADDQSTWYAELAEHRARIQEFINGNGGGGGTVPNKPVEKTQEEKDLEEIMGARDDIINAINAAKDDIASKTADKVLNGVWLRDSNNPNSVVNIESMLKAILSNVEDNDTETVWLRDPKDPNSVVNVQSMLKAILSHAENLDTPKA